jgi:hypothetical protein
MNLYESITKQDVISILDSYVEKQEQIYVLLNQLKQGVNKDVIFEQVREIYGPLKEEIQKHYKALESSKVRRNRIADAYLWPPIQDIHVHISGFGLNRLTLNGLSDFHSALYDIGSYANYWKSHLED